MVRRSSLRALALFALLGVCSCERKPSAADSTPPVTSASVATVATQPAPSVSQAAPADAPAGSPLSRLVPKPLAGPRAGLPMTIVPGVGFGPISLGDTLEDLKRGGLAVSGVTDTHADVTAGAVMLRVSLCAGKIIDIWIDDLRKTPPTLSYEGRAIAPTTPREDLEKTFGGCTATPGRIGGAFEKCHDGGLYVGHGMGDFIQIRVRPKAFPFDDACSFATDDGSAVELTAKERSAIFKTVLNLNELSKHWHVGKPGRDPLRIVRTPLVAEESLTMFGSPVKWIDEKDATKGSAYFVLTKIDATKTKTIARFAYPIEGLTGTATFNRSSITDEWRLVSAIVAER